MQAKPFAKKDDRERAAYVLGLRKDPTGRRHYLYLHEIMR
jgi:hypothetical protein